MIQVQAIILPTDTTYAHVYSSGFRSYGQAVYMHGPSQLKSIGPEDLSISNLFKLIFEKIGSFLVIKVQSHTLFIEEDIVRTFNMIDRFTLSDHLPLRPPRLQTSKRV